MIEQILVSWSFISAVALSFLLLLAINGEELPDGSSLNKAGKAVVLLIFLPTIIILVSFYAFLTLIHDSLQPFKKKQERKLLFKEFLRGETSE